MPIIRLLWALFGLLSQIPLSCLEQIKWGQRPTNPPAGPWQQPPVPSSPEELAGGWGRPGGVLSEPTPDRCLAWGLQRARPSLVHHPLPMLCARACVRASRRLKFLTLLPWKSAGGQSTPQDSHLQGWSMAMGLERGFQVTESGFQTSHKTREALS